jgi:lysozyme
MKTSAKGRAFIESFEGLYLHTYDDGTGTLTIGYGHTTAAGPPIVHTYQTITKQEADEILSNDLAKVERQVESLVKVPLNQNQFDALVSFHFNTGALAHSSSLVALNKGDYITAANDLLLYNKGRVHGELVVMAGLVRRREGEKAMFLSHVSVTPEPMPVESIWTIMYNFIINLLKGTH